MNDRRRDRPLVHISWIKSLFYGDNRCKWATWYRANFYFSKTVNTEFDSVSYNIKHAAIRNKVEDELYENGFQVIPEYNIRVQGKIALLIGTIDLVSLKDDLCLIVEIKSGKPYPADKVQLLLYMWALPYSSTRFKNLNYEGALVYPDQRFKVSSVEIDEDFCRIFAGLMKEVVSEEPKRRNPSIRECKFCNIANCDERLTEEDFKEEESDFIANFF